MADFIRSECNAVIAYSTTYIVTKAIKVDSKADKGNQEKVTSEGAKKKALEKVTQLLSSTTELTEHYGTYSAEKNFF